MDKGVLVVTPAPNDGDGAADYPLRRARTYLNMPWLLVAIGGALGALSRYALDRAVVAALGPTALGIFLINVTGSFLLGLFVASANDQWVIVVQAADRGRILGLLYDVLHADGRLDPAGPVRRNHTRRAEHRRQHRRWTGCRFRRDPGRSCAVNEAILRRPSRRAARPRRSARRPC